MTNGKNPLMLMMALSMPGAANALGLGDIHVDSALNERLAAEIDIVGASAEELSDLRAAVANQETFLRYGADRPNFLASAIFKVIQDSQGRPVLAVRSTEAFTEPMINFLVDLRWHNGALVRQYTLLLDPPGIAAGRLAAAIPAPATAIPAAAAASAPVAPATPEVPAAPPRATPLLETRTQTVARQVDPPGERTNGERARKTTRIKVGAKATLRGIAWRIGEREPSDLQRMMIALFRANPSAFDGNINRLHLGAVLAIPSVAEVAAISKEEAKREFHVQMAAWHRPARALNASSANPATSVVETADARSAVSPTAPAPVVAAAVVAAPVVAAPVVADAVAPTAVAPAAASTVAAESDALNKRIQSLEHELVEAQGVLESQRDELADMRQPAAPGADAPSAAEAPPPPTQSAISSALPAVGGFGLLAGALAALYYRLRRRVPRPRIDIGTTPPARFAAEALTTDTVAPVTTNAHIATNTPTATTTPIVSNTPVTTKTPARAEARTQTLSEEHQDQLNASYIDASEKEESDTVETARPIFNEATQPLMPVPSSLAMPKRVNNAAATISPPEPEHTTVNMRVETVKLPVSGPTVELTRVDATRLDYNLVDLDMTAQHVQMPSVLNENAVVKERRTNLADVLKMAIEREPDRHDLRMKLLELYYAAASTNRQAFLDVVQKFARDRDYLNADQWEKIAFMGRQIAAENPMFVDQPDADDDLANCA